MTKYKNELWRVRNLISLVGIFRDHLRLFKYNDQYRVTLNNLVTILQNHQTVLEAHLTKDNVCIFKDIK